MEVGPAALVAKARQAARVEQAAPVVVAKARRVALGKRAALVEPEAPEDATALVDKMVSRAQKAPMAKMANQARTHRPTTLRRAQAAVAPADEEVAGDLAAVAASAGDLVAAAAKGLTPSTVSKSIASIETRAM